jgi:DNA-binding MarR family transcriptional regulator
MRTGRIERSLNMTSYESLRQMKKANKLARLAFRKNGPKSYKRGQGALLNVLYDNDGITQRELVKKLGISRGVLKDSVKKAERNGYVTIGEHDDKKTYTVNLTDEGRKLAKKRREANEKVADDIMSALDPAEVEQLDAITEKLIVSLKDKGISGKGKGRKAHGHHHKHHAHCHC